MRLFVVLLVLLCSCISASSVSDDPVGFTPHVLDGRVYAIARVGSRVVLGGTFSVARNQGEVVSRPRPWLLAFDAVSGRIDEAFVPRVNGAVFSLAADPSGSSVFVGGAFSEVNGVATRGLTKLNLADGSSTPGFRASATGSVYDVGLHGSSLFVGGVFGRIGGVDRAGLAVVDRWSGAVGGLNIPVTSPMRLGDTGVRKLDVSPDGSRLVIIGNFRSVGGQPRTQMAIIDLSRGSVWPWSTDLYGDVCNPIFNTYMRDVDISPDGSFAVVVTTGGPGNGTDGLCDSAARWDLNRIGSGQLPTWTDWTGGDTLLSVAVTAEGVYVGGHQRWQNNAGGRDAPMPWAVPREGIAELSVATGRPLAWNPGRARGYGASALLATPEGLYVGSDTERLGGEFHARIGLFPR